MILGDGIYLRLMEERDIKHKVKWLNDPEVRHTLNFSEVSEVSTKQWLNKVALDTTRKDFIACVTESHEPIGYCGFMNINLRDSKVETYMGIGNKEFWGKGYGEEIKKLLVEYAFEELGVNRVYSYVWPNNKGMIKINQNLGLKIEGHLRQDVFSHGVYRDRLLMSILKEDYFKSKDVEGQKY